MKSPVIAVIGVGNVGATTAYSLILKNIASKILLIDINKEKCQGEALDLSDSLAFSLTSKVELADYSQLCQADIIIISAGKSQEPGQSRLDLINTNKKIILDVCHNLINNIKKSTIVIIVTNPVDIMTYYAYKALDLPFNQIIGTGTYLDTQRLKKALSETLYIAEESVDTYIIGEHGDSQVPLWSHTTIGGQTIKELDLTKERLDKIAKESSKEAYSIIESKGATYYGVASCVASLCEIILFNKNQAVPVSFYNNLYNCAFSFPVTISNTGITKVLNIKPTEQEIEKLNKSIKIIKENLDS